MTVTGMKSLKVMNGRNGNGHSPWEGQPYSLLSVKLRLINNDNDIEFKNTFLVLSDKNRKITVGSPVREMLSF